MSAAAWSSCRWRVAPSCYGSGGSQADILQWITPCPRFYFHSHNEMKALSDADGILASICHLVMHVYVQGQHVQVCLPQAISPRSHSSQRLHHELCQAAQAPVGCASEEVCPPLCPTKRRPEDVGVEALLDTGLRSRVLPCT